MSELSSPNVVILSGGIGGAKLVDGFARLQPQPALTVIGNIGDDIEQHGLWVSPDLDIVTYTLAKVVDTAKGWGYADETFHALDALKQLGEDTWMNLGDRDLATHIYRTQQRRAGVRPTEIAQAIARGLGVQHARVLPPTDADLQTMVTTSEATYDFQTWYLKLRCGPEPVDVTYAGSEVATITSEVNAAVRHADLVVIAPSNPIASVAPILAVQGMRTALEETRAHRIAVSPLVGGRSLKGPSDRMMRAMGYTADAPGVADYYKGLIDALVIDDCDTAHGKAIRAHGIEPVVTRTIMKQPEDRITLARAIIALQRA